MPANGASGTGASSAVITNGVAATSVPMRFGPVRVRRILTGLAATVTDAPTREQVRALRDAARFRSMCTPMAWIPTFEAASRFYCAVLDRGGCWPRSDGSTVEVDIAIMWEEMCARWPGCAIPAHEEFAHGRTRNADWRDLERFHARPGRWAAKAAEKKALAAMRAQARAMFGSMPLFDTLVRGVGVTSLASVKGLFG